MRSAGKAVRIAWVAFIEQQRWLQIPSTIQIYHTFVRDENDTYYVNTMHSSLRGAVVYNGTLNFNIINSNRIGPQDSLLGRC